MDKIYFKKKVLGDEIMVSSPLESHSKNSEKLVFWRNGGFEWIEYERLKRTSHVNQLNHYLQYVARFEDWRQRDKIRNQIYDDYVMALEQFYKDVEKKYSLMNMIDRYIGHVFVRPFELLFDWLKK